MNKTYSDFTDLYDGLRVTVDSETKQNLDDHFMFREVNDNDKFKFFYQRNLNLHYHQYELLLLDELSQLPELVDYKEYIINQKKTGKTLSDTISNITSKITSDTENKLREITDSDSFSGTDAKTGTEAVATSYSEDNDLTASGSKGNTGTQTTAQTADSKHVHIEKALPQSLSYASSSAGVIPDLNWGTASGQSQDADNSGTTQRTDNLSESVSNTESRDIAGSGSDTTTYNTTNTKNGSHSSTMNEDTDITKSGNTNINESGSKQSQADEKVGEYKRRDVMTQFETILRENLWDYISNHHAIETLFDYLEPCFMPVGL